MSMLCASSFSITITSQEVLMVVLLELHIAFNDRITSRLNGLYFSMLLTAFFFHQEVQADKVDLNTM